MNNGNYTASDVSDAGTCAVCGGTGWEPVIQQISVGQHIEERKAVRRCTCCNGNHKGRVASVSARAGIPVSRSLSDFDWSVYGADVRREETLVTKFVELFREFERENLGLYITSRTRGSGKTFLASAIGGELIKRYETSVRFVSVSELLDIALGKRGEEADSLESLMTCRVLILDDLGQKQTGRDWLSDVLFRIIDSRYRSKKTVILTSNVPLPDLDFDDRIVDRLNAMTVTVKIPEFCVRAREANNRKKAILKKLGIM